MGGFAIIPDERVNCADCSERKVCNTTAPPQVDEGSWLHPFRVILVS
jgi:hypothetical protein